MVASDKAKTVVSVELNKDAVKDAIINAKKNEIKNIRFFTADAGEFMEQLAADKEKIDVVFMDPPRNGSDEKFLKSLLTLKPDRIVYISCGPESLARDLNSKLQRPTTFRAFWQAGNTAYIVNALKALCLIPC